MSYFEKANDLYNNKSYKEAINMYRRAIESHENVATSLYNCGVCYIKLKEYKDAVPFFKSAARLKNESKYFFNLGYCYSMINDDKKALLYFNTAWSLDNNDFECEKAINLIIKKYQKVS